MLVQSSYFLQDHYCSIVALCTDTRLSYDNTEFIAYESNKLLVVYVPK